MLINLVHTPWQDVLNLGTWQEVLPYTWYDIYVESNNILMESPTPEVDLSVDKRCTASFTILDIGALKHFKKGQEVEIYSDHWLQSIWRIY